MNIQTVHNLIEIQHSGFGKYSQVVFNFWVQYIQSFRNIVFIVILLKIILNVEYFLIYYSSIVFPFYLSTVLMLKLCIMLQYLTVILNVILGIKPMSCFWWALSHPTLCCRMVIIMVIWEQSFIYFCDTCCEKCENHSFDVCHLCAVKLFCFFNGVYSILVVKVSLIHRYAFQPFIECMHNSETHVSY